MMIFLNIKITSIYEVISKKGDIIIVFYEDLKSLVDFINDDDCVEKYEHIYKA